MKIGLDLHDTIDAHPKFFAELTKILQHQNIHYYEFPDFVPHEVHIMTGAKMSAEVKEALKDIWYTHFFSILEQAIKDGVEIAYNSKGLPWMDSHYWNKAKALYAMEHQLDLVIDNDAVYAEHYVTPCAIFRSGKL